MIKWRRYKIAFVGYQIGKLFYEAGKTLIYGVAYIVNLFRSAFIFIRSEKVQSGFKQVIHTWKMLIFGSPSDIDKLFVKKRSRGGK